MRVYRLYSQDGAMHYEKYDYFNDDKISQLTNNGYYYKSVMGTGGISARSSIIQYIVFNIDHNFISTTDITNYRDIILSDLRDEKIGGLLNGII